MRAKNCVRTITPKQYGIHSLNFTYDLSRRCVARNEENSDYFCLWNYPALPKTHVVYLLSSCRLILNRMDYICETSQMDMGTFLFDDIS